MVLVLVMYNVVYVVWCVWWFLLYDGVLNGVE